VGHLCKHGFGLKLRFYLPRWRSSAGFNAAPTWPRVSAKGRRPRRRQALGASVSCALHPSPRRSSTPPRGPAPRTARGPLGLKVTARSRHEGDARHAEAHSSARFRPLSRRRATDGKVRPLPGLRGDFTAPHTAVLSEGTKRRAGTLFSSAPAPRSAVTRCRA